jgi:hypothetical protein
MLLACPLILPVCCHVSFQLLDSEAFVMIPFTYAMCFSFIIIITIRKENTN